MYSDDEHSTDQLPIEGASCHDVRHTYESSIVLSLCSYAYSLDYLTQVDKILKFHRGIRAMYMHT